jgi:hypothetical protein
MKRHEAINCLREINNSCYNLSPAFVALMDSKRDDQLSIGYQVHIQGVLDQNTRAKILGILSKYDLALNEEPNKIVIYKPKTVTATPKKDGGPAGIRQP